MKKASIILGIIALAFHLSAAAQQPDAVYRLVRHEWTLNTDGTSDYRYRHEVQILRNRALTAYADKGETFVVYNPDIEEVTVNEVYTIQLDGSRVDMPQNAFIHQLPAECADCGRFNHLRELTMVHTGMEIGCLVVVDYTVHRRHDFLHETLPLLRECPIERLEIKVNAPRGMEVRRDLLGEDYLPNGVTKSSLLNGDIVLRNLPQAPREDYMPEHIVPTIRFFNGPIEFSPAVQVERFTAASDAVAHGMRSNPMENVVAIRNFVLDNIHLNAIHPRHLNYTRATAAEVWNSGCGTATEKAVLLASILSNEGYSARVVGDQFDQVVVYIDTLEYTLDPHHRTPPAILGKAKDVEQVATINNEARELNLDTLEGGIYRCTLPIVTKVNDVVMAIAPQNLPTTRTTPLQAAMCDLTVNSTYLLPKGLKVVGGEVNVSRTITGLGSVEVSIVQKGNKIVEKRRLVLKESIISVEDYAKFRQLMALYYSHDTLMFRGK